MVPRMCGMMICLLLMSAGVGWGADATRITQLASKVHTDLQSMIKVQKLKLPDAVRQQKTFLLKQPEVLDVQELKGNNLMVKFKDGNELLMFLRELPAVLLDYTEQEICFAVLSIFCPNPQEALAPNELWTKMCMAWPGTILKIPRVGLG